MVLGWQLASLAVSTNPIHGSSICAAHNSSSVYAIVEAKSVTDTPVMIVISSAGTFHTVCKVASIEHQHCSDGVQGSEWRISIPAVSVPIKLSVLLVPWTFGFKQVHHDLYVQWRVLQKGMAESAAGVWQLLIAPFVLHSNSAKLL